MNKDKYLTIRITDELNKQLTELCKTWKLNKTQVIERLIYGEYLRTTEMGKQEIESVMSDLSNLNEKLKRLGNNVQ